MKTTIVAVLFLASYLIAIQGVVVDAGRVELEGEAKVEELICPTACPPGCIAKNDGKRCYCECPPVESTNELICPTDCPPNCVMKNDGKKCYCDCT
ncbi:hypothetical protein H6P81_006247 [Aristolochia fimbriata]|uniref:Uncharacterized protein n=1 Tax=Aristolochia fimbriata TaxID=158543 RepID=A0AAV7EX87_ARIFI|nr:hypothetical protein H6P81_006247 [Aristolochia fimbriata]